MRPDLILFTITPKSRYNGITISQLLLYRRILTLLNPKIFESWFILILLHRDSKNKMRPNCFY
jgi:hypothetical protein